LLKNNFLIGFTFLSFGYLKKKKQKGPCQFPTLGFVVRRYLEVERFIPEPFWKIEVKYIKVYFFDFKIQIFRKLKSYIFFFSMILFF